MKKITLALPALAAALLAVSACAKHDDTANSAATDLTSNDESGLDGNVAVDDTFTNEATDNAAGGDALANDASVPDNAAGTSGNGL